MCANIYISHVCLMRRVNRGVRCQVSVCRYMRSLAAQQPVMRDKPYQLPNLFHHEVGAAEALVVILILKATIVSCSEGMHC